MEHKNDPDTDYGYGYLHMKSVWQNQFTDQNTGAVYDIDCAYEGAKINLYNNGGNKFLEFLLNYPINEER